MSWRWLTWVRNYSTGKVTSKSVASHLSYPVLSTDCFYLRLAKEWLNECKLGLLNTVNSQIICGICDIAPTNQTSFLIFHKKTHKEILLNIFYIRSKVKVNNFVTITWLLMLLCDYWQYRPYIVVKAMYGHKKLAFRL